MFPPMRPAPDYLNAARPLVTLWFERDSDGRVWGHFEAGDCRGSMRPELMQPFADAQRDKGSRAHWRSLVKKNDDGGYDIVASEQPPT